MYKLKNKTYNTMEFAYLILIMAAGAVGMAFWLKVIGPQKTAAPLIKEEPEIEEAIEAYFSSLRKVPPVRTATRKRFRLRQGSVGFYVVDTSFGNWYTAGADPELVKELIDLLNAASNPILSQPERNVIVVNRNDHTECDEQIWIDTFNFNK